MASVYESGIPSGDTTEVNVPVAIPVLSKEHGSYCRQVDVADEYTLSNVDTPFDQPCRISYKFASIGNIYTSAPYINESARAANCAGVRNSFSYSETGRIHDGDSGLSCLVPVTLVININESVINAMSSEDRVAFVKRALGAFLASATATPGNDAYVDYIKRLHGILVPTTVE